MSVDDDDRDVPDCFYPPLSPGPIRYRIVPGFPRYRVGSDQSVWFNTVPPGLPHGIDPRWRRLKSFTKTGHGPYVLLRHEGRECIRTIALLHRAAFSDPSRHEAWIRRIGPLARLRRQPAVATGTQADSPEGPSPLPLQPTLGTTLLPAPAAAIAVMDIPADERRDPYSEYRPVPDFPGYEVGSDYSCWTCRKPYGQPHDPGEAVVWRRVPLHPRPGKEPAVMLFRKDRAHLMAVASLVEKSFRVILPEGNPLQHRVLKGSDHGRAVLDEAKVIEARRLKRKGWTYQELAQRYGVCRNTVVFAVTGKTWTHVPMEQR